MFGMLAAEVMPYVKLLGFMVLALFIWALKSTWSEKSRCRDCQRCTEPIITRMWKTPMLGPVRAIERVWLRTCPTCRHRLLQDHGVGDDGRFLD